MFYCFVIREEDRDYLRYLWYEDNDISKNVVEYRMKVHLAALHLLWPSPE